MTVPSSVARGMVFSGSFTWSAGTVAHSSPRNAHMVRAAQELMAESGESVVWPEVSTCTSKWKMPKNGQGEQRRELQDHGDELQAARGAHAQDVDAREQPGGGQCRERAGERAGGE